MNDLIKYSNQVQDLNEQNIAHKQHLKKLIQELGDYPELLWSEKWNSRMFEALASILQIWQTAESMVPPARLSRFHEMWLEAADHERRGVQLVANYVFLQQEGRQGEAMAQLGQATTEFNLSASAIDRSTAMFR